MKSEIKIEITSYDGIGDKWDTKDVGGITHITGSLEHYLGLKGTNTGNVPIKIASWGFELPNTEYVTVVPGKFHEPVNLPIILLPGKSINFAMAYSAFATALKKGGYPDTTTIGGYFQEQDGTKHQIKGNHFNQY